MDEGLAHASGKIRFFQLYLLSYMRVEPAMVGVALRKLDATEEELEAVRRDMRGRGFETIGGPSAAFFRESLGPPVNETLTDDTKLPEVFQGAITLHFKLPLWPDFEFIVNELPDGGTFNLSFKQSPSSSAPRPGSFLELEAWKFIKEEIDNCFEPLESVDAWDSWEEVDYMIPGSPGERPQKCSVFFDFNLLQFARWSL